MKPKWRPRQVTSSPLPIKPVVTPSMGCSPVLSTDFKCRSMLRERSKQRSMGGDFGGELNVDHGAVVGSRHGSLAA